MHILQLYAEIPRPIKHRGAFLIHKKVGAEQRISWSVGDSLSLFTTFCGLVRLQFLFIRLNLRD